MPLNWTVGQGSVIETPIVNYRILKQNGSEVDTIKLTRAAKDGSVSIGMVSDVNTGAPCVIGQRFPFTGKPQYFSMNYGYFPGASNDQFQIVFIFTKWNPAKASKHDTILSATITSATGFAEPWQTMLDQSNSSLAPLYSTTNTENPDTAFIAIINSHVSTISVLFIDQIWFTDTQVTTGIDQNGFQQYDPSGISAYPNPFTGKTNIHYNLTQTGEVSLNVFDIDGKQVAALVNGDQESGPHDAIFDASDLKSGVYFYRLQSGNDVKTGKLMLAR